MRPADRQKVVILAQRLLTQCSRGLDRSGVPVIARPLVILSYLPRCYPLTEILADSGLRRAYSFLTSTTILRPTNFAQAACTMSRSA